MARRSSPQQTQANGHGRLSSLREQVEEQELRAKLAAARQQARLVESVYAPWGFGGSWGDVANPFGYRLDATGGLWLPLAGGSLHSRQAGRYRPFAWADIDLDHARSLARWLAAKNDLAIGALKAVVNFTVKKGYTWKTRPSKGNEKSPAALQLAAAVQRLIDDHSDRNGLPARERSACRRAVRDGEAFVRHFAQDDGTTRVRFVEPEQVREQAPAGHDPDGAFGVVTAPGDVEDVRAYCVTYDGVRYETVDAAEVSHIKRNVDECVKRGLSDFFSSGEALDDVAKLLRNMRVSGSVQAAVAWTEQFKGVTLTQVQAHVAGIRDLNRGQPVGPLSGRELNYQKIEPGTVRKVGEGMEQVAPPVPVGASVHIQIVQSALRAVGCRWNMPEYMVSGDSSGANFAGTLVAGSPFVNSVECEQDDFGLFFLRWRWVAVRNACEAGLLGPYTFAQVQDLIDIHFTPPQVAVAKEAEQATIDHEDIAAGVMSLQTRRARRGLDDEQERENLRLEPPTRLAQRAQDLDPRGNPVGGFGRGQSAAGGIRPDLPKPAPPGSKDGPGLPTAVREVKDDAGHEHADDGKFTGTGGGGGVTHDGGHATATPVGRIKLRDGVLGKALDAMGGAAAGAKAAAGRFGEAAWASLDDDDRRVLSGAYAVGRWVARRAETLLSKGRQLSGEIARERGLSHEQAARVERVVGLVDTIAAWTVNVPAAAALTGNPLAGKAAGLVPVASMAYLAYSTARNPLAVLRAAKTTLTTAAKHESVAFLVEGLDRAAVEALCDGYRAAEDPDWYTALVLAALDLHGQDLAAAVGAASEAAATGKPGGADDPGAPAGVKGLFESRGLAEEFDAAKHPRGQPGNAGQFGPGGGGKAADAEPEAPDADANRPSHPDRRHKAEDGEHKSAPALPEKFTPPAPTGRSKAPRDAAGKPVTGYSANGIANTYTGDLVEDALSKLQMRSILPLTKAGKAARSHAAGEVAEKGSSLDREFDHSGQFFEVKTVCVEGSEYKAKPKASEMADKRRFAELHSGRAATMVVVMDTDALKAHAYWRDGIGAFALNPNRLDDWNYAGSVELDASVVAEARRRTAEGLARRKAAAAGKGATA